MRSNKCRIGLILLLCVTVFFVFQGCGKKGPPVLPVNKGQIILAPIDLKLTGTEDEIELTWGHKADGNDAGIKPEGFDVFLKKLTFEDCEGCPFEFKKVGTVPMPAMRFVMKIDKGYRYYFRVQARGKDNLVSEFTKTVLFENR